MTIENVGSLCCGCRTCKTVCPTDAITIVNDKYGFEFPHIDISKCIECGKCASVCPALHINVGNDRFLCGAAYAIDAKTKFDGSSGGLFGVFSKKIIRDGGIVFGAVFDSTLKLKTTSAQTLDDLDPLYKSKYLLCDTNDKFVQIRDELESGRRVLYCSSPCQIAALNLFLGVKYANLITVDFVCHGVGSQSLFNKSIEYSEQKLGIKINTVKFRYKTKSVSSHNYYYKYQKGDKNLEKKDLYFSFPYYNAFCKRLSCRISCFTCQYATESRVADITIGDFHTIEKYDSEINRFAGVSMFVCNTTKGIAFFNEVSDRLYIKPMEWDVLRVNNRFGIESQCMPAKYELFMDSIVNDPFAETVFKFLRPIKDWKWLIYYKAPKYLRDLVRKKLAK